MTHRSRTRASESHADSDSARGSAAKPKMNDIIRKITTQLGDEALQKLHIAGVDINLRSLSQDEFWWFERVCFMSRVSRVLLGSHARGPEVALVFDPSNPYSWKQTWIIVKRCIANIEKGMDNIQGRHEDNPLVIDALLAMGFGAPTGSVSKCIELDLPVILKKMLSDERIRGTDTITSLLFQAIGLNKPEMLSVLLSEPGIETGQIDWVLVHAVGEGMAECVSILIADERVNPSYKDNRALRIALESGRMDIVEILTSSPRMDANAGLMRVVMIMVQRTASALADLCRRLPSSYVSRLQNAIYDSSAYRDRGCRYGEVDLCVGTGGSFCDALLRALDTR